MADIRYQFVSTGANAVLRDWQSLTSAAQRYAAEINKLHKAEGAVLYGGGSAGAPNARRGGMGVGGSSAARDAERNRAYLAKIRDKHFADEQRAEERAAAKKVRTEEQSLRRIERMREASRAKELRETERAEKQRLAIAEKSRIAEAKRSAMARDGMVGSAFRGVGGVAMGLGAAGIGIAVQATRDAMRTQELANRVSINARKSGESFIDPTMLRKEWEKTAEQSPGQTAEGVGTAVQKFITMTGDIDTARKGQGVFATVASATGADIGDIAEVAASLSQHFDVKGLEEMRDVLASLTFQGKEGAFELKDAASMYQRLAASAAAFGVEKSGKGVKMLGGLTQIARTGTGSAEQAATAIENMFTQFKFKAPKIKDAGVDVYKDGKVRPIEELIPEVISKVGGTDIAKKQAGLTQIFGEQGIRAINPLVAKYNQTYQATGGTKDERVAAAMAAVSKEIDKAANAAGTWADVQKDAARNETTASAQMTAAWERVVAVAAEEVVPALIPLIGEIGNFTGMLKPAIESLGLFLRGLKEVLEFMGLIKPKTPEEELAKKKDELKAYDDAAKNFPGQPLTPKEQQHRAQLANDIKRLEGVTGVDSAIAGGTVTSFKDFGKKLEEQGGVASATESEGELKRLYSKAYLDPVTARSDIEAGLYPSLTAEGRKQAIDLTEQVGQARQGVGELPAWFDESEKLAPAFTGLGEAAALLQKALEAAAATGEANLLGGGPS